MCQGVWKKKKQAHNFLFPRSSFRIQRTTVLGMFKDFAILLDAIGRHSWPNQQQQQCLPQFESVLDGTSLLIFTSSLQSRNREYHPKKFDQLKASFARALYTNTSVSVAGRPALKQIFIATLCSFPPSMMYKENWLYKTSNNSYTVEDKQTKFGVWTDIGC